MLVGALRRLHGPTHSTHRRLRQHGGPLAGQHVHDGGDDRRSSAAARLPRGLSRQMAPQRKHRCGEEAGRRLASHESQDYRIVWLCGFPGVGDLIDGALGGYSFDNFSTESAVTWLRTKARELKAQGQPWFMAVNLVNPHDVMYVNSDAPGEVVQGKHAAYPIDRPPDNEIYVAEWDVPLPATRHQLLNAPDRPRAHYEYQATQDILLGQWPDEDRRWRVLQNYYFNCIRDCDRHLLRLLEELKANALDGSTIVV